MKLLVTRPAGQAQAWVQRLGEHGVQAQALPLIEIAPPDDVQAVRDAWQRLDSFGMAVFVSPNAASQFFAQRPQGLAWPEGTVAATPGPGTDAVLGELGVPQAQRVVPGEDAAQFDSEALWALLRDRPWQGVPVLIVRGDGGRDWLAQQLHSAGARVSFLAAYGRRAPVLDAQGEALLRDALAQPGGHLWVFSSSEAIDHLETLCAARGLRPDWGKAWALASHPRIAQRARALGCGQVIEVRPSLEAVLQALATAPLA